ncbi:MAG: hypothetical protein II886_01090 [Prevotella sp.]|nr:hypothetical protein [Prevotella sp.]
MDKKDLKWYVSPEMETYEAEMESTLLDVSIDPGNDYPMDAPGIDE